MTPADKEEFRRMLVNALQPLQDEIDSLKRSAARESVIDELRSEITALKEVDRKHSGQHRLVTGELLPRMVNDVERTRAGDLAAFGQAIAKLVDVTNETVLRQARADERAQRTEEKVERILKQNEAALVQQTDERGTISIKPASLVAAETTREMQRDVAAVGENARAVDNWQKRVTTPLLVIIPLIFEIIRQLQHR